ncbi:L,D-transpeptidase family protein [Prauserella rugosa]|uniref:L,D-transpeptidase-like protein n=1 Tax=Prauserella rugosa TaxID=43354 RepID=A0A660CJM9_9PSEU|nr:L,D-transpeptidase [Prauserella rugosa]TWH21205.1 L,D-transpeptidase-like protein [Prauserella rugosa]
MERRSKTRALSSLAAAALLALLVSACGGGDASDDASGGGGQAGNAQPVALTQEQLGELPDATTFGNLKGAPTDPSPDDTSASENGTGTVLHPKQAIAVYDEPGGDPFAKLPRKQISSPTWVPVIEERGDWAHILLPARPNGASGWVYTGQDAVETATNDFSVLVHRDDFSLEIREKGEKVGEWTIGIGSDEHPTPKGRAYIIASIEEQVNDYSPIVLPLSSHSDSHETFGGGPGTVGIHTWPDDSFVGKANSDGCLRVTKEALDELVKLPLGTMVEIV